MYVFVYGTLKHGFGLHALLEMGENRYRGWAYIDGLSLYDWGSCPAAFVQGGSRIWGEVYEVDDATLNRLDAVEAMYTRKEMTARITEGSVDLNPIQVGVYVSNLNPTGGVWIPDGVFRRDKPGCCTNYSI